MRYAHFMCSRWVVILMVAVTTVMLQSAGDGRGANHGAPRAQGADAVPGRVPIRRQEPGCVLVITTDIRVERESQQGKSLGATERAGH